MTPPHISFPGRKSRRDRQTQRRTMDAIVANNPSMQGERDRGRQSSRQGESDSMPPPPKRPRGGQDGMALDDLGYRTYSPQPSGLRRRGRSPQEYTTRSGGRQNSPPSRRYAPRSTTSGNLSFDSLHQTSSRSSGISSLNIGPPAVVAAFRSRGRASESNDSSFSAARESSASRNALTRVQRSEYQPERESPREALRRSQMNSRVPEYARRPERAVPVESVRQRGIERYLNADGFPNWYEQNLRNPREGEGERENVGRGRRVEQQGFRKWFHGR